MYKLNFNHLYYFLTIAQEGSIVKAAKRLGMTQPSMSHQLRLLEQDLGKKLFDRVGKKLVLNQHGDRVREHAHKIFRQSEEMIKTLKNDHQSVMKLVKVGVVPWLPKEIITDIVHPFVHSRYHLLQVYQGELSSLLKDLEARNLDIIICDDPYVDRSKKFVAHKLKSETVICVSSKEEKKRKSIQEVLQNKRFVRFTEQCALYPKLESFFKRYKLNPDIVAEFVDSTLLVQAIEKGLGLVGFIPQSLAKHGLKQGRLFKLGNLPDIQYTIWGVTLKGNEQTGLMAPILKKKS